MAMATAMALLFVCADTRSRAVFVCADTGSR